MPGRVTQGSATVMVRLVCERWDGDIARTLEIDPDGTPVLLALTVSAGLDHESCRETPGGILTAEAIQFWT